MAHAQAQDMGHAGGQAIAPASSEHAADQPAAHAAGQAGAHAHGQQHPLGIYFKIWGLLFVLSIGSYLVDYFHVQSYLRWSLIVVLMLLENKLLFHPYSASDEWEAPLPSLRAVDVETAHDGLTLTLG